VGFRLNPRRLLEDRRRNRHHSPLSVRCDVTVVAVAHARYFATIIAMRLSREVIVVVAARIAVVTLLRRLCIAMTIAITVGTRHDDISRIGVVRVSVTVGIRPLCGVIGVAIAVDAAVARLVTIGVAGAIAVPIARIDLRARSRAAGRQVRQAERFLVSAAS
jgi:hypothetical protein